MDILTTLKNKDVQIGIASATSALIGAAGGYFFSKNRLRTYYEEIAMREIEEAKEFYGRLHKNDEENATPEKVLERLHGADAVEAVRAHQSYLGIKAETPAATEADLIEDIEGVEDDGEDDAPVTVINNIFLQAEGGFDYETEVAQRTEFEPYIVTEDEYMLNEMDYEQSTLTYYEGDGVLADDEEIPVPDSNSLVGDDNLVRFGHGSKNENVVFVRNDRLEMEFEIERSYGSYAQEVAGFDEEDSLKHSEPRGLRKFRGHDD